MKNLFSGRVYSILLILTTCFFLFSCKKSENSNNSINSFTWTFQGINYTANQDTAFVSGQGIGTTTIYAGNGISYLSFTRRFYFYLTSFNVGSYTFGPGPGSPNHFNYIDEMGFDWGGTSGTFNITAKTNNMMSGNFSGTLNGPAGNQPVSGNFTSMPVKP